MYQLYIKRFGDLILSILGFITLLPLFTLVAIFLFIVNNGKPFFMQKRPGKNARIFTLMKFKTMNDKCDSQGCLLDDSKRLTKIGAFIRKTSLDELPQLINVIKGDMSLIGPRPLLVNYLPLYDQEQRRRHEVLPGITGWAQINGRNAISWEEKFKLDVWYVDNISFRTDVKILAGTVMKVIRPVGITSDTSVTMERFEGVK